MIGSATFGGEGTYRYLLTRIWDSELPAITWVMLNPSTATASNDDQTISRVIGFSIRWGYGSVEVVNLFAFRARSPSLLRTAEDPVGQDDDRFVTESMCRTGMVITAWGNHGELGNPATGVRRCDEFWEMIHDVEVEAGCLGITRRSQPAHPLYLPGDTKPTPIHSAARPGEEKWNSESGTRAIRTRFPAVSSPTRSIPSTRSSRTPPRGSPTAPR